MTNTRELQIWKFKYGVGSTSVGMPLRKSSTEIDKLIYGSLSLIHTHTMPLNQILYLPETIPKV
jgi:hypothetical protein